MTYDRNIKSSIEVFKYWPQTVYSQCDMHPSRVCKCVGDSERDRGRDIECACVLQTVRIFSGVSSDSGVRSRGERGHI